MNVDPDANEVLLATMEDLAGKADKDGILELIDTFTLDEPAVIELSKEPDGTPYNFDAIMVELEYKGAETIDAFNFPVGDLATGITACQPNFDPFTGEGHGYFIVFNKFGFWRSIFTSIVPVDYSVPTLYTDSPFFAGKTSTKKVPAITYAHTYVPLPAGFKVTVKGVRKK